MHERYTVTSKLFSFAPVRRPCILATLCTLLKSFVGGQPLNFLFLQLMYSTMRVYDDNICRPLANMKENTVQKYNDVKDYGTAKLTLGAATVKTVLDAPVNRINQRMVSSLNQADSLVDKLLPRGEKFGVKVWTDA